MYYVALNEKGNFLEGWKDEDLEEEIIASRECQKLLNISG
jgi:hypothetical protein